MSARAPWAVDKALDAVRSGDRAALARAITRVESTRADDRAWARELLHAALPFTGAATRIGITGVPGVGKSTFIDVFGTMLADRGHRVAVLAVDPSSSISGGSILGDKSRMLRLSVHPRAFIRPTPSALSLGGVARRTREVMTLCEAAGHDVVLVETVGVGQSEVLVADMVDYFLLLLLPGAGDELQGIKKGVLEHADGVAVQKADGDNVERAALAASEVQAAFRILGRAVPVTTCSALLGTGIEGIWDAIDDHRRQGDASGAREERRQAQRVRAMHRLVEERLIEMFWARPDVQALLPAIVDDVRAARQLPDDAAESLLARD